MPSSLATGERARLLTANAVDALKGQKFRLVPDFFLHAPRFAAADLTGANSGFWIFAVPKDCVFIGAQIIWATAGTNTLRVKKVLAAATSAPGAAADASNVDISAAVDLTATANVRRDVAPVTTSYVNKLAAGDKVAIASSGGTASLAGALIILQFAWV